MEFPQGCDIIRLYDIELICGRMHVGQGFAGMFHHGVCGQFLICMRMCFPSCMARESFNWAGMYLAARIFAMRQQTPFA